MPEASIDEHRHPLPSEHDVCCATQAGHGWVIHAESVPIGVQKTANPHFRNGVTPQIGAHGVSSRSRGRP